MNETIEKLKQATSFDTAYLINDYPYGFTLRCKKKMWVEYRLKKGYRLGECTTNPKLSIEKWNKPKYSTYSSVCGFLVINPENDHIQYKALSGYGEYDQALAFYEKYKDFMNEQCIESFNRFMKVRQAYDKRVSELDLKFEIVPISSQIIGVAKDGTPAIITEPK